MPMLPTPIGLLQEKGLIGQILRQLPYRKLEEAEKRKNPWVWLAQWVARNPVEYNRCSPADIDGATALEAEIATYQKAGFKKTGPGVYTAGKAARRKFQIREVRFYHHAHEPNRRVRRVITNKPWPGIFHKTLVAAASQREAELRLAEIARGGGSISQSWRLKIRAAQKSGDRETADHWADKLAASMLQYKEGREHLLENMPPEIREVARQKYEQFHAADVRRLGRKPADEKWKGTKIPRFKMKANGDSIAETLITCWLTVGHNGFPGLCFMSDELLAQLLGYTLPLPSLLSDKIRGAKFIWQVRNRTGLQQAEILFTGMEKGADNKWAILDRHGKKTHWISLTPNQPLPPKL